MSAQALAGIFMQQRQVILESKYHSIYPTCIIQVSTDRSDTSSLYCVEISKDKYMIVNQEGDHLLSDSFEEIVSAKSFGEIVFRTGDKTGCLSFLKEIKPQSVSNYLYSFISGSGLALFLSFDENNNVLGYICENGTKFY